MDLRVKYMGLDLKNPLVAAASPLTKNMENFQKLEDAGIGAIVCHSIFEEQITQEAAELDNSLTQGTESYAEALSYFPQATEFKIGPDEYLEMIRSAKSRVSVPVIASLNGHTQGGWIDYAKKIEQAGADAIELNVYFLATKTDTTPDNVESNYEAIVRSVKANVTIPVAVKMSPYFSALANMVHCLDQAKADGVVLFNRFYQPDINLETLEVEPNVMLSTSSDLRLPLRWIAILYGQIRASLAATSGIHTAEDAVKAVMAGADAVMLCSVLLKNGIGYTEKILKELAEWVDVHGYASVREMRGIMSQKKCARPEAFERANYMKVLNSY